MRQKGAASPRERREQHGGAAQGVAAGARGAGLRQRGASHAPGLGGEVDSTSAPLGELGGEPESFSQTRLMMPPRGDGGEPDDTP